MCEDLHTDVKGEYLGASGNPMHTAFERGQSVFPCINIPQCRHFVTFARAFAALGNVAVYPVWHTVLYILHHLLDRLRKGY